MQPQHHALLAAHLLLPIGIGHQCQDQPVHAQGGLHHVGQVLFASLGVGVGRLLLGKLLVLGQVEVAPMGDAPQLAPTEGKAELDVRGGLAVVGKLLLAVIPQLSSTGSEVSAGALAVTLLVILLAGLLAALFSLRAALSAPLLPALRSE